MGVAGFLGCGCGGVSVWVWLDGWVCEADECKNR